VGEQPHVLVTGATGLIGRALVERLASDGTAVTVVVRPGSAPASSAAVERHELDLTTPFTTADLPAGRVDAVVHLAQHRDYASFPHGAGSVSSITIAAACRLAEYACELGASRFVFASSGGIYAPSHDPVAEDAPIRPPARLGFYLTAKAVGEQLLAAFRPQLELSCLRYFFVYGPGQQDHFLIPRLVAAVCSGTPVPLAAGRGPRINPVHVRDAVAATAACVHTGASGVPEVLNVAGPTVATVREIATMIGAHVGREPQFVDVGEEPADLVADLGRMRSVHEPAVRLEDGLADACG